MKKSSSNLPSQFVWATLRSNLVVAALLFSPRLIGANFQNLDFESAIVPTPTPDAGSDLPTTEAFPGWTACWFPVGFSDGGASLGYGCPATAVKFNGFFLTGPSLFLIGSGGRDVPDAISGKYSAGGKAEGFDGSYPPAGGTLSQVGTVPQGTKYLEFDYLGPLKVYGIGSDGWELVDGFSVDVSLGGVGVLLSRIGDGPSGSSRLRGDISAWAGSDVNLEFTIANKGGIIAIDNIALVPEPEAASVAIGILLLAGGLFWRQSSRTGR